MSKKLTVIDLFSGCGGFSEGFMQTGDFEFLAHVEWEKPMVDTLRENFEKRWNYSQEKALQRVIHFDIQKTDELIHGCFDNETLIQYGRTNSKTFIENGLNGIIASNTVDLIIGGPPCQAYSLAGRAQDPNSMKDDYRNYLFESFIKVVNEYQPKLFVFENVPGILSASPNGKPILESIYKAFNEIGYEIKLPHQLKKVIYSSADFGVPQERQRVIIIGVKKDLGFNLDDFYGSLDNLKNLKNKVTVKDAIGYLPKFRPLELPYKVGRNNISHEVIGENNINLHKVRYHNLRDINIFKLWLTKMMNNASTAEKLAFYEQMTGRKTNHAKYRNLEWDKPAPTIVSHLYKDGLMFIHPDVEQVRSITIREAALLQSFPIDYKFIGSDAYCFKMIGNAVPVLLAKNIGLAISQVLYQQQTKPKKVLNILVACEESQAVCKEFRKLGHNAYSCDLLPCSGGHPEWHFNHDVLEVIENKGGLLQNGETCFIDGNWDLMVAHPPCTYLAVSGAKWYYHPDDKDLPIEERRPHPKFPNRAKDREEAIEFFIKLANADIDYIAIENPVGVVNTQWRRPDQVVQPYHFGDNASKKTCLWLKNLPLLEYTDIVDPGEFIILSSGKRLPKWYSEGLTKTKSVEERRTWRSKTFLGFAKALATQWSEFILNQLNDKM